MVISLSGVVPMDVSSFANCKAYSSRRVFYVDLNLGLSLWQGGLKVPSCTCSAIIF